jgi:prepilin-type N-terminal cleavage/methylation domain-containing protein/prepilin-type processing-associated H-X9-DG protein
MPFESRSKSGFTLVELLVVIAIIALLMAILIPVLAKARSLAAEKSCASNLRQVNFVLVMYAGDDDRGRYPLEPTEHNPHPDLLKKLTAIKGGLIESFYCPRAKFLEKFASNSSEYIPDGATDTVIDTAENRQIGNISYVYWSFIENKYFGSTPWRNPEFFIPRQLMLTGVSWLYTDRPSPNAQSSERWVATDFFRRGAPFPHGRKHARGLNVVFLDGHVSLVKGKPKENYR